ncbi:hypothetical protein DLREEDagrD3_23850 [Denitratisoma sp. agr-D3]
MMALPTEAASGRDCPEYGTLMAAARLPDAPLTLALAGVLAQGLALGRRPLLPGMDREDFHAMLDTCFPGIVLDAAAAAGPAQRSDEYDDLVNLLLDYRDDEGREVRWLSHAIATACLSSNHLWQDLGLPNRAVLSCLMTTYFPRLAALNVGDMKWKKFFYRQLCEKEEILICKSPNCMVCDDHGVCFGAEEGESLLPKSVSLAL